MFGTTGVLGTAGFTLALSQFQDKAQGIQDIFFFLALFLLLSIPLIMLIPDPRRQRRIAVSTQAAVAAAFE